MSFLHEELAALSASLLPAPMRDALHARANDVISALKHGDLPAWQAALDALPDARPAFVDLALPAATVGMADQLTPDQRQQLLASLNALHPWRKGPFELFGTLIDCEWRSDFKWTRIEDRIQPLSGRHVLDVGCGNGYYALRMVGAGAASVTGVDPTLRFIAQFGVFRHYLPELPIALLPLRSEDLPDGPGSFDTVFSMGVIYHRRSPLDHLAELAAVLRPGGQLVLETLIVPDSFGDVLMPADRYAKMRNVWFLPSAALLVRWLERAGFRAPEVIDISPTTAQEQRRTAFMQFESLDAFLDPEDPGKTVEGYPAPLRAVAIATRP